MGDGDRKLLGALLATVAQASSAFSAIQIVFGVVLLLFGFSKIRATRKTVALVVGIGMQKRLIHAFHQKSEERSGSRKQDQAFV